MEYEPIYAVGSANFEEIRRKGCVYVDKTEYVWKMTRVMAPVFLSRPRRFGKSLLTSTLECYFKGKRELFEGLRIAERETEWREYPVLRFDLSRAKEGATLDIILDGLYQQLAKLEDTCGISDRNHPLGERLAAIISAARERTGEKVVVLIDEYDAPLNNNIDRDDEFLAALRSELRSFFAPIKACEENIRFAFLTGITRYSQLGIFSELNNLKNISMLPEYAGICGITQEELDTALRPDVELMARKMGVGTEDMYAKLKYMYDGYHMCKNSPNIYSPFSLMNSFSDGDLNNYWFGSATPTMLMKYLEKSGTVPDMSELDGMEVGLGSFDVPLECAEDAVPLLYQAGYLTIHSYDAFVDLYTLCIPNNDVRIGLSNSLMKVLSSHEKRQTDTFIASFKRAVRDDNMARARELLTAYLAGIPCDVLSDRGEKTYHAIFYALFSLLGFAPKIENGCARGYSDMIFETKTSVYCMEFKVDKSVEEALRQIEERGYLEPYAASGKRLVMVGVNFSTEKRNIDGWVEAPLQLPPKWGEGFCG